MAEDTVHWADVVAKDVLKNRGNRHVIATGITPSGPIHIGNMREVVTADAVRLALKDHGADVRLHYIADSYDPLRKVYPFLSEDYASHVGKPISEIPDPDGCCANYAEHFLQPFLDAMEKLGIGTDVTRADQMYKRGDYADAILTALINEDKIAQRLAEVTGRTMPQNWSPFNPLCEQCGRITMTIVTGYHGKGVDYECQCGHQGTADISKGDGKLTWRVDWPARWKILGITVEPFGKDHAVAGGSYDTGIRIAKEVYDYDPPYPIPFEHIFLKGHGKMSSSAGVVISVQEMLDVLPPEVLRYLIIRAKPERHIDFDPGAPLLNLIDEYDRLNETDRSYELSTKVPFRHMQIAREVSTKVPFRHMVTIVQIARNFDRIVETLKRSGYEIDDVGAIKQRAKNAENWLNKFAPSVVKFKVRETLPNAAKELSPQQKRALNILADEIGREWTADALHAEIYQIAGNVGVDPKYVFEAAYIALLGTPSGPRAGWFLTSLSPNFIRKRFKEAST
ncbi:MAG: lysine--tRNA ligase [Methanosarcinales archaeon Met12]|nr:MAG: lysine--tRNA ligase [Methanosarcinales archaeon Met12]